MYALSSPGGAQRESASQIALKKSGNPDKNRPLHNTDCMMWGEKCLFGEIQGQTNVFLGFFFLNKALNLEVSEL